jgi:hypothetical protein
VRINEVILSLKRTLRRIKALSSVKRQKMKVSGHTHVSSVLSCGKQLGYSLTNGLMVTRIGLDVVFAYLLVTSGRS